MNGTVFVIRPEPTEAGGVSEVQGPERLLQDLWDRVRREVAEVSRLPEGTTGEPRFRRD